MNCDEVRRHWDLYYDSEGDAELHFQINEHLGQCAACAEWFHEQGRLEELIVQKLGPTQPTAELWSSVLARSGLQRPGPVAARRLFLLSGIVALAAGMLVGLGLWMLPGIRQPVEASADLARLTAGWHEQLINGRQPVGFASRSDLEVEAYLRPRVSFPVRCPPRQDSGFLVNGAGTCRLAGSEAAYLVGQVAGKPVSIFILPREELAGFPHQWEAVRREGVHRCTAGRAQMVMAEIDRNVVLVIGDGDAGSLQKVLNAYGTYPDHHAG